MKELRTEMKSKYEPPAIVEDVPLESASMTCPASGDTKSTADNVGSGGTVCSLVQDS